MERARNMAFTLAALAAGAGCAPAEKAAEGSESLGTFGVAALPDNVHPTFIDFGGKVHVVGYEVSPEGAARPGQSVSVALYWQRVGALEPGWGLFTHLEDDLGRQIRNFDREGEFRGKVAGAPGGLALLTFGTIYKDDQKLEIPKAGDLTPRISLVVGVWNQTMRLPVVSGSTNGHDAALIAEFSTGVERQRPVALRGSKP
jgi:hypothetical protein